LTSIFNRYLYNYFDNFHILGTLPIYGYIENKVNEWMNEPIKKILLRKGFSNCVEVHILRSSDVKTLSMWILNQYVVCCIWGHHRGVEW